MHAFLIQHVDAVVITAIGLGLTLHAWLKRESLLASPNRLVRAQPVLAPLALAFGLLRFALDSQPRYTWRWATTIDGRASAEFPCETTAESTFDVVPGGRVKRQTVRCGVPGRDIDLRLSVSELPRGAAESSLEQKLAGVRAAFEQQKMRVISTAMEDHGGVGGFRVVVESEKDGRMIMRVAVTPNGIYRAAASSTAGFHDDPVIPRFLESFRIQ